jgi:Tol biopolymer transport system component
LNPAVSPDGGALVFNRCATDTICDLFLAELSKNLSVVSEPKRLTSDTSAHNPAWTPEGRAIIFSAGPIHAPTLWKVALSQPGWRAGKPEWLAFAGEGVEEPTLSRQGRLVYRRMSFDVDIWRADLNNGRPAVRPPTKLISSTRVEHEPRYSPDGKRVAFCSNRSGGLELWVCNSDGSNPVQLTSFGGPSYTGGPHWSPDGQLIVFSNTAHGKVQVYVISSEGGRPKPLAIEEQESWSRDGKWIYFASNRTGSRQLWKMPWPPTGQDRGAIQVTKEGFDGPAAESHDGTLVYYLNGGGLWRSPVGGGEERRVLRSVLNNNFAVVPEGIYFIPSSPPYSVRFLGFSSGKEVAILTLPREPSWGFSVSADGRWLLYSEYEAVRSDLMLVENFR